MKQKLIPILISSALLTAGCQENLPGASSEPAITKSEAVAEVNGKFISKKSFDTVKSEAIERNKGKDIPDQAILDELIKMELLVQEAEKKNLTDTPELMNRLAMAKRTLISQAAVMDYIKSNPVSDEDLKAEYDKQVSAKAGSEYKARHILLKTEEEAIAVIKELNNNGDFQAIAKTKSTGPSGPKGGDLGWFAPARMVPPFSEAVIAMENGQYTKTPVQTQFGWHVILREDSREQTPPPFDSIKAQFRPFLERQKLQNYMDTLHSQAKIEKFLTPPVEAAPTETLAPTP
ncbi:MAG: peptidylprolyl isomerase, partial [Thiotrichaceae bacterium]|nr:peptidylprolyl isomerase [Thiotrichaceae bacterium]